MFVVFEGIDGSGKSTQLELCQQWLESIGRAVTVCRDPGTTEAGNRIREILLHRKDISLDPVSEMFLFMAARAQMVQEVIRPALDSGKIVLCDRFLLSTVVYQGHAGGLDREKVLKIGETATGGLKPDATLVFDVTVERALQRIGSNQDRMESKGIQFLESVIAGFRYEAKADDSVILINADGVPDEIHREVRSTIEPMI